MTVTPFWAVESTSIQSVTQTRLLSNATTNHSSWKRTKSKRKHSISKDMAAAVMTIGMQKVGVIKAQKTAYNYAHGTRIA